MRPSKIQIIRSWDKIAARHGGYGRANWPKVEDFLRKSRGALLDVGCGNASYLKSFNNAVGVDASFETCKLAKRNIKVICGDATCLPIKSHSFSRVLSKATLHILPTGADRTRMLEEIKRVLKPRGVALITVFRGSKSIDKKLGLFKHFRKNVWINWGSIPRYYHLFSKRELSKLASKVFDRFEVKLVREEKHKNLYLYVWK